MKNYYGEDYKHFDNLIWSLPNWSTALFTGVIIGIWVIKGDEIEELDRFLGQDNLILLLLLAGAIALTSLNYTLFRFRYHQKDPKVRLQNITTGYRNMSIFLGAQKFLQFTVTLETAILWVLLTWLFTKDNISTWIVGIVLLSVFTLGFEIILCFRARRSVSIFED